MLNVLVIVYSVLGWSKEIRTVGFDSRAISSCGSEISWQQLMPSLSSKEQECLDMVAPIVIQNDDGNNSSILSRTRLVELLKQGRSECLEQSEINVPEKVTIRRLKNISESVFGLWLASTLSEFFPGKEIEIGKIQFPNLECSRVKMLHWGSLKIEGKNTFRFLLSADDKNFGLTGEFRVFQNVPVALRNLQVQDRLDKVSFDFQKKDVTFNSSIVSRIEDLEGRVLVSPIAQGEVIPLRALKSETTIEKGQIIRVQFKGDNFELTSQAIAEQSGSVGELIKIKNIDSQKILSGIVVGKGQVEVQ